MALLIGASTNKNWQFTHLNTSGLSKNIGWGHKSASGNCGAVFVVRLSGSSRPR